MMTFAQAQEYLGGVSRQAIYNAIRRGSLAKPRRDPVFGKPLFSRAELDRYRRAIRGNQGGGPGGKRRKIFKNK